MEAAAAKRAGPATAATAAGRSGIDPARGPVGCGEPDGAAMTSSPLRKPSNQSASVLPLAGALAAAASATLVWLTLGPLWDPSGGAAGCGKLLPPPKPIVDTADALQNLKAFNFNLSEPAVAMFAGLIDRHLAAWAPLPEAHTGSGSLGAITPEALRHVSRVPMLMSCCGHLRVIGGKVYFRYGGFLSDWYRLLRFHQTILLIQDAIESFGLQDLRVEMFINTCDHSMAFFSSHFIGRAGFPVMSTEITEDVIDIAIPDPLDLSPGYTPPPGKVEEVPWDMKVSKAAFRGATTNFDLKDGNYGASPRIRLHRLTDIEPDLVDARVHRWSHVEKDVIQELAADGVKLGGFLNASTMSSFKYQIIVDGGQGSCRTCGVLRSSQLALRQRSPFKLFFEPLLVSGIHMLETTHNFDDLFEKVKWAKEHDTEVQEMVNNANRIARWGCSWTGRTLYWGILLVKYSKLQSNSSAIAEPKKLCDASPIDVTPLEQKPMEVVLPNCNALLDETAMLEALEDQVQPPKSGRSSLSGFEVQLLDAKTGAFEISWSDGAALRVLPAGSNLKDLSNRDDAGTDHDWATKLEEGFIMEYSIKHRPADVEMAELVLDMRPSGHWFGGGHFMKQHWPLNLATFEVGPFFPFDNGPNGLNTLTAPQWMTSKGLLVLADPDTPFLHVGMNAPVPGPHDGWIQRSWGTGVQNLTKEYLPSRCDGSGDGLLRIQARSSYFCHDMLHPLRDWMPPILEDNNQGMRSVSLRFALCAHENVKEATLAALRTLNAPANPPPRELVEAPIWTTWARYHANVNQAKVESFAKEIVSRGLERSVMEIDDKWQSKYGDFTFDTKKFPDPKAMVDALHALGFKVTVWVMPFAEESSEAYKEGSPKGYFIKSDAPATFGLKQGFFRWWQPVPAAALDVTNPEAVEWFVQRLKKLQEDVSIDGFKFDAGEPCFLPRKFRSFQPISTPIEYTRLYVQEVASNFPCSEVRTGHRTNSVPLLTRMGDRFSTWSSGNGLRSVIPTLLTSGLLGYPFCLPDMIGGNGYFGRKPDMELLVRWAQANAFMPAMQFSIPPWDVSKQAEKLCQSVMEIRKTMVQPIVSLMEDACKALSPVCRPMWWLDPEDHETFSIGDQFSLGDDLIIAPVVVKGQKQRDVYLPKGQWMELLGTDGIVIEGPCWIRDLPAPLHKIPIFRRVKASPSSIPDLAQAVAFVADSIQPSEAVPTISC
eukprot:SM000032S12144  [mRNA]  locus=s32:710768:722399:- [translate_table: standard]